MTLAPQRNVSRRLAAVAFGLLLTGSAGAQVPAAQAQLLPGWEPLGPLPGAGPLIVRLSTSTLDPDHVHASSTAGLLRSTDRGASWSVQARWPGVSVDATFFDVAPTMPARVAIARVQFGPRVSQDGGATWLRPSSLPLDEFYYDATFDPVVSERLFFAATSGVWRSTDGGQTFTHALDTTTGSPSQCTAVLVDRNNHLRTYAFVPQVGVYLSRDGGDTWELRPTPSVSAGFGARAIDPTDGRRLLVADATAAFLTEDEGLTWTQVGAELGFDAISFDPLERDRFYASRRHDGLLISDDAGLTWTMSTDPGLNALGGHPYAILPSVSNPGEVLAVGRGGAFRSVDGGQSFQRSNAGLEQHAFVQSVAVDAADPAHLVARTGGSVFVSLDAGASWSESNAGSGLSGYDVVADAALPGRFYLQTLGEGTATLRRSDDGGFTFNEVHSDPSTFFWHLDPHPTAAGVLFAAGRGVSRSDDGGVTFTSVGLGTGWTWDVAVSPADPGVLYASKSTVVHASHDGGATWTAAAPLAGIVRDLEADPTDPDRAWACVPDHGLYRTDDGGQTLALLGPQFEWANAAHVPAWNSNLLLVADVLRLNVLGSFTGGNQSFDVARGLATSVRCLSSSPFETYAGTSGDGVVRLR